MLLLPQPLATMVTVGGWWVIRGTSSTAQPARRCLVDHDGNQVISVGLLADPGCVARWSPEADSVIAETESAYSDVGFIIPDSFCE